MSITDERALAAEVQAWAERHGLPPYAPVAMAEQVAIDALLDGASTLEACDRAAAYLQAWYAHPAVRRRSTAN
jgi:hypothetical protein